MDVSNGSVQECVLEQLGMVACRAQGPHPSMLNYFLTDRIKEGAIIASGCVPTPPTPSRLQWIVLVQR